MFTDVPEKITAATRNHTHGNPNRQGMIQSNWIKKKTHEKSIEMYRHCANTWAEKRKLKLPPGLFRAKAGEGRKFKQIFSLLCILILNINFRSFPVPEEKEDNSNSIYTTNTKIGRINFVSFIDFECVYVYFLPLESLLSSLVASLT